MHASPRMTKRQSLSEPFARTWTQENARGLFLTGLAPGERAVAIMLSLDLAQHPHTQGTVGFLAHCLEQSGRPEQAVRLRGGDISDLKPVIAQIELEHRAWVAEDWKNRHFGPPSFFITSEDAFQLSARILAAAGVDVDDFLRRIKSGELSGDDFAKLVAETLARRPG
jgi:hypothetical protein